MADVTPTELAVALFDLAWLLPRTIGVERDPSALLPGSELEVMRLLVRFPAITVSEVAAALHLQPANVSTSVRSLESRGLLQRRRDGRDGRKVRLHPTPRALSHREDQESAWGQTLGRVLAELPPDDARRLLLAAPSLRRLAGSLTGDG